MPTSVPRTRALYRHYQGGLYRLLHEAILEATEEPVVVYRSEADGRIWVRSLREWNQKVQPGVRRFERVPE